MKRLLLSDIGLLTVAEACQSHGWSRSAVNRWIRDGLIPVFPVGEGEGALYLLRKSDLAEFDPPKRGRKHGSKDGSPRKKGRWENQAAVYQGLRDKIVAFLKARDNEPARAADIAESLGVTIKVLYSTFRHFPGDFEKHWSKPADAAPACRWRLPAEAVEPAPACDNTELTCEPA